MCQKEAELQSFRTSPSLNKKIGMLVAGSLDSKRGIAIVWIICTFKLVCIL
jgi:hypothetical protein